MTDIDYDLLNNLRKALKELGFKEKGETPSGYIMWAVKTRDGKYDKAVISFTVKEISEFGLSKIVGPKWAVKKIIRKMKEKN